MTEVDTTGALLSEDMTTGEILYNCFQLFYKIDFL